MPDAPRRNRYRPTSLKLSACGLALDYYQSGAPYLRDIFQPGTAAHVVLERLALAQRAHQHGRFEVEALADTFALELIRDGRRFEGGPPEMLDPEAVWEGRNLAVRWVQEHGLPSPTAEIELGIAFSETPPDRPWTVHEGYSRRARARCILDYLDSHEGGEADEPINVLEVVDYKSAWPDTDRALLTVQRKFQAVAAHDLALARGLDVDVIRLGVANLRRLRVYEDVLDLGSFEDQEKLARWRLELSLTMQGLDEQPDPRPAKPGAVCLTCPYVARCQPGANLLREVSGKDGVEKLLAGWVFSAALTGFLENLVRLVTDEDTITLPDGSTVGHHETNRRLVRDGAESVLLDAWLEGQPPTRDSVLGLLRLLRLGVGNIDAVLGKDSPLADQADALEARLLERVRSKSFGVQKSPEAGGVAAGGERS